MNQTCKYFSDLINEYLDNTLSDEQTTLLEKHISSCKSCHNELKEVKDTIHSIKNLATLAIPECSENFTTDIIAQLKTDQPVKTVNQKSSHLTNWSRVPQFCSQNVKNSGFLKYAAASIITAILIGAIGLGLFSTKEPSVSVTNPIDSKIAITTNTETDELSVENLFYENDSILADSGMPLDEWGLIDVNGF